MNLDAKRGVKANDEAIVGCSFQIASQPLDCLAVLSFGAVAEMSTHVSGIANVSAS